MVRRDAHSGNRRCLSRFPFLLASVAPKFDAREDYYAELGVPPDADAAAIKRAYRKKALESHPDANKDPDAQEKFIRVLKAYEVLSNPEARAQYDTQRRWRRGWGEWVGSTGTRGGTSRERVRTPSGESYPEDLGDSLGAIFSDLLSGVGRMFRDGNSVSPQGIFNDFVEFLENQGANWGSLRDEDLESVLRSRDENVLAVEADDAAFVRQQCEQRLQSLRTACSRAEQLQQEWARRAERPADPAAWSEASRERERELADEVRRIRARMRKVESLIAQQRLREERLRARITALRAENKAKEEAEATAKKAQQEVEEELERLKRDMGRR